MGWKDLARGFGEALNNMSEQADAIAAEELAQLRQQYRTLHRDATPQEWRLHKMGVGEVNSDYTVCAVKGCPFHPESAA